MKPVIYIHTNDKQILGAKLAAFSFKARSKNPEAFDVKLIRLEDTPHLYKREGQTYLRKGKVATWYNNDLQSFSPLRMLVPQLMGFQGKALLTDPDVFAIGDVYDLLSRDMGGKSIICRNVPGGYRGNGYAYYATSVMLLDCARLSHWKWNEHIDLLFDKKMDYGQWISLKNENPDVIGDLEAGWNDFDTLTPETKLLHTTERSTQPWRTGLPVDFDTTTASKKEKPSGIKGKIKGVLSQIGILKRKTSPTELYLENPDPNQEVFILNLINEALEAGAVTKEYLDYEISKSNLRKDIYLKLKQVKK